MDSMTYVQRRGVGLYVDGGQLKAYPRQRLTPELRSFIKDHRDELIDRLKTPDIDVTVGNILALTAREVEELRAETVASSGEDPWLAFDRDALRIADIQLAKRCAQTDRIAA